MTKLTNNGFVAILDPAKFDKSIGDKFKSVAATLIDNPRECGFLFARYTLDSGAMPSLMPHCDRSEPRMGLYGTVELNKTIDWDFYVEDEKFDMAFNRSVWFTGTHQPHWRPDANFGPEDYYDIIRYTMDLKANEIEQKHKDLLVNGLLKQYNPDGCQ
jgi:hypothetical protein